MLVPGRLHLGVPATRRQHRRHVDRAEVRGQEPRVHLRLPEAHARPCRRLPGRRRAGRACRYAQARSAPLEWTGHPEQTAMPTVAEAMADYVAHLRTEKKTGDGAEQAARVHILPVLGATPIDKLTLEAARKVAVGLVAAPARLRTRPGDQQRTRARAADGGPAPRPPRLDNRVVTTLKAALAYARRHHADLSDSAWRQLKPYGKVDKARTGHLSVAEAQRLIGAADAASGFRPLVEAALLTGCRYGELLASLRVADFAQGRLTVREFEERQAALGSPARGGPRLLRGADGGPARGRADVPPRQWRSSGGSRTRLGPCEKPAAGRDTAGGGFPRITPLLGIAYR